MSLLVCKYGGSSIASIARIQHIAEQLIDKIQQGHQVVVVLSAMQGTTDRLVAMADQVGSDLASQDVLLATGEMQACALMSLALQARGQRAQVFSGAQAGLLTDDQHTQAKLLSVNPTALEAALSQAVVPVVAGFQGVCASGRVTTMGRGGSDLTAVALASSLKADDCLIYTDVPGIYSADPKRVPKAQLIPRITWQAMLTLSCLGAKVLQAQAALWANEHRVPVRVLSSFFPGPGSLVAGEGGVGVLAVVSDAAPSYFFEWQGSAKAADALIEAISTHQDQLAYAKVYSQDDGMVCGQWQVDGTQALWLAPLLGQAAVKHEVVRVALVCGSTEAVPMQAVQALLNRMAVPFYHCVQQESCCLIWVHAHQGVLAVQALHEQFLADQAVSVIDR